MTLHWLTDWLIASFHDIENQFEQIKLIVFLWLFLFSSLDSNLEYFRKKTCFHEQFKQAEIKEFCWPDSFPHCTEKLSEKSLLLLSSNTHFPSILSLNYFVLHRKRNEWMVMEKFPGRWQTSMSFSHRSHWDRYVQYTAIELNLTLFENLISQVKRLSRYLFPVLLTIIVAIGQLIVGTTTPTIWFWMIFHGINLKKEDFQVHRIWSQIKNFFLWVASIPQR